MYDCNRPILTIIRTVHSRSDNLELLILLVRWLRRNVTRSSQSVSSGMSGRLVHELEYHYSGGTFGEGPHANITIRYYQKMDRFAEYKLANNSNFAVLDWGHFYNQLV